MSMFLTNISSDQVVRKWHTSKQKLPMYASLVQIAVSTWSCTTREPRRLAQLDFWTALATVGLRMVWRFIILKIIPSAHTSDQRTTCSSNSILMTLVLTTCNWSGSVSISAENVSHGQDCTGGTHRVGGCILILWTTLDLVNVTLMCNFQGFEDPKSWKVQILKLFETVRI